MALVAKQMFAVEKPAEKPAEKPMSVLEQQARAHRARMERLWPKASGAIPSGAKPPGANAVGVRPDGAAPDDAALHDAAKLHDRPHANSNPFAPPQLAADALAAAPTAAAPTAAALAARVAELELRVDGIIRKVFHTEKKKSDGMVMLAEIKDAVAKFYNVTLMELEGESRDAGIVKPRHVGMYLARKLTRNGLPSIAHAFNRSHHTTSLNAFQRISRKLEHDEGLRAELSVLMGMLDKTRRPA